MDPRDRLTALLHKIPSHLLRLEDRARVGQAPPDVAPWLAAFGIPRPLVELLTTCWPQATTDLVPFMLLAAKELTTDADVPRLLAHGLLMIGFCPNGDPLVLDLTTDGLVPGAVEHGKFAGGEPEDDDPRAYHRPLARDVATLFERLAAGLPVPRDDWAALDFDPLAPDGERLG